MDIATEFAANVRRDAAVQASISSVLAFYKPHDTTTTARKARKNKISNPKHRVVDTSFDEKRARNRRDHGPENPASLLRLALNVPQSAQALIFHPTQAQAIRTVR